MMIYDVIVIGAGASGIVAAITASKNGKKVLLLERNSVIGKKLALTGNGRCNLTHSPITKNDYYGTIAEDFDSFYSKFNEIELMDYFAKLGLLCKNKNGYIYPYSEQASMVVDLLMNQLKQNKVEIQYRETIRNIIKEDAYYSVISETKNTYKGKVIIVAVGGKASPKTGSDGNGFSLARKLGIETQEANPGLVAIHSNHEIFAQIAGVRWEGKLELYRENRLVTFEIGELQFVNYGISGIPAFQISRFISTEKDLKSLHLQIDFFPAYSKKDLLNILENKFEKLEESIEEPIGYEQVFQGFFQNKLLKALFEIEPLKAFQIIRKKEDLANIIDMLKQYKILPNGTNSFEQAQVTVGGITRSEVSDTCELLKYPNVYVVGELLDIDGKCGGYNLQWAFMSGIIAARDIIRKGHGY